MEFIAGTIAFWTTSGGGVLEVNSVVKFFLNGSKIPLDLIWPPLTFQPFAFTLYHAMKIYLGQYSYQEIGLVFLGGLAWCVVLYILAMLIFKAGLKKNESVGL